MPSSVPISFVIQEDTSTRQDHLARTVNQDDYLLFFEKSV